jgi:hypothetical protein
MVSNPFESRDVQMYVALISFDMFGMLGSERTSRQCTASHEHDHICLACDLAFPTLKASWYDRIV